MGNAEAMPTMTDSEVERIVRFPKRIGEQLRWIKRKDDRPEGRELRARVVPFEDLDYEREITFVAENYRSRTGSYVWSVGLRVSGLKRPLIRIDTHVNPHRNPDNAIVTGCMMHRWCEAYADRFALPAKDIVDCSNVDAALVGFLLYCHIELTEPYKAHLFGESYGGV